MKRSHVILFVLVSVLGFKFNQAVARDWIKEESEHFVAYSNISEASTRDYLRELESFKFLAEMVLGSSKQSAIGAAKFTVYFLDSQEMLDIVRPGLGKQYVGLYVHCSEGAVDFAWMQKTLDSSGDDYALITTQHEYAHHLMFSHLSYFVPRWYVEGFAEYLSTVVLRRGKFIVGESSAGRTSALLDEHSWIDFRTLLDTKKYMELLKKKKVDEGHFYAQSWLLTHYMLADSDRTKAFNQYFDQIGHGADPISSFETTTGIAVDKLESILKRYLSKHSHLAISVPEIPDSSIVVTKLAREQSDYVLEDATLQTCPNTDQGKQILEKLRAMRNRHLKEPEFHLAIDRAELLYGDATTIRADLEQLVETQPTNFAAHYLLGRIYYELSQDAKHSDVEWLDKARQEFIIAYKLDKLNAPNMFYLAKTFNGGSKSETPSRNLLNAASGAAYLMPSVFEYAILAADVNMRADNRDQAIRALQPFVCNPHDSQQAASVARVVAVLAAGKSFYEAMRAYNDSEEEKTQE